MPVVRIIEGSGAGQSFELVDKPVAIGRDPTNPIHVTDPKSSRVHAELRPVDGRWHLKDLGSSNGTWSDRGRIDSIPLIDGFTFRIGKTYFRFESRGGPGDGAATQAGVGTGENTRLESLDKDKPSLLSSGRTSRVGGKTTGAKKPVKEPAADASPPGELARINAYLVLLHQLVLKSNEAKSRDQLFELLDDAAAEALDGDRCAVFLPAPAGAKDADGGWALWPAHERRLRARYGAIPFARTLLTAVRARKEPMLVTLEGDLGPSASMVEAGVRSAMAAPLRIGGELHALLYVDRIADDTPFTRTDLEFLSAVANQLAVVLHNRENMAVLEAEVGRLQTEPRKTPIAIIGKDPALKVVEAFIAKAGPTDAPVLILGESGTGKELAARALHQQSKRADRPLQVVNCAAIAESLVESTLFGHVKGAFTGADETRPGLFELSDKATLFLDEVGELPQGVQAKLLRALEQGEVQRVGDGSIRRVDVRLIAATNRDLKAEVKEGRFRSDLLHRLDVLAVTLPPLRARPGDIDLLVDHFLAENARRLNQPLKKLSPEARTVILRHGWPGNVRQLRNVIERACIMAQDKVIQAAELPESIRGSGIQSSLVSTPIVPLHEVEKAHIIRVLDHCGGNKKAAAEILQIDRSTLYAKLRQYGQM